MSRVRKHSMKATRLVAPISCGPSNFVPSTTSVPNIDVMPGLWLKRPSVHRLLILLSIFNLSLQSRDPQFPLRSILLVLPPSGRYRSSQYRFGPASAIADATRITFDYCM